MNDTNGIPERATFEVVHQQFQEQVYDFTLEQLKADRTAAEAVTIGTFAAAYRAWDTYHGPADEDSLRSWLLGLAARMCETPRETGMLWVGGQENVTAAQYQAAVAALSEAYRQVWQLATEQKTYQEIADALELRVPAVKVRLHRARAQIKKALEDGEQQYPETNGPD